jgi:hypothetical protein
VQQEAMATKVTAAYDDDDRESTTPSKRKQLPHNPYPWGNRLAHVKATPRRYRQCSFMLYLTAIFLCGLTLMNMKESETLSRQSAKAIRRIEDLLVLPTTLNARTRSSATTSHPEHFVESLQQQHNLFHNDERTRHWRYSILPVCWEAIGTKSFVSLVCASMRPSRI